MKIGVIGDDFTGSGDVANTLARAGARTLQYVGIPTTAPPEEIDAVVVSLKTRSLAPEDAVAESLAACRWLVARGAQQILFKYCSTFDSTPEGNIGPVAAALLDELAAPLAFVCPAFPANGRTVYSGHLFVHDRLLSESGMESHPLNPMTDPDIRRWLAGQTSVEVGHLPLSAVRSDIAAALAALEAQGMRLVVADAVDDSDLLTLGRAARGHRLVTGGSGIAMGLPNNFGILPRPPAASTFRGTALPGLVISGSCSPATRTQVAAYQLAHPSVRIGAKDLFRLEESMVRLIEFIETHRDAAPLIYSTDDPEAVAADQAHFGRERLARLYDDLFARLTEAAVARGFRRVVAAGGETSGAVATALGETAFEIGPEIATGVPALFTVGEPHIAVALKSGNFGAADFFERAISVLGGQA